MEKVGEEEEKTIEEANNSVEETRSDKEDERIRDTITEEGSTDPSNSQTLTFEYHDVSEHEMEDEEVLELFRRNSGVVASSKNFPYLYKSEEMVTEETNAMNLSSPQILEGIRSSSSSSSSNDSSGNSDLNSSLSRYYFDGSLPETHEDESLVPKDENQKMSLLCPKRPTSWRNLCGLFELLRAADP
ncbi:uncharacterized protein LOC108844318 isoform X1 [Raphanus sativus]|uniref:Uncharacterized protein LOC108844318 isoform X1 n=1 Tax=Raphanus sativus TaxID=3726 RepID=A0A6J0MNG2_RAPSA|nr:uncharacterized protein LOC108844318 isoform X1 [Raphanus sativus]